MPVTPFNLFTPQHIQCWCIWSDDFKWDQKFLYALFSSPPLPPAVATSTASSTSTGITTAPPPTPIIPVGDCVCGSGIQVGIVILTKTGCSPFFSFFGIFKFFSFWRDSQISLQIGLQLTTSCSLITHYFCQSQILHNWTNAKSLVI